MVKNVHLWQNLKELNIRTVYFNTRELLSIFIYSFIFGSAGCLLLSAVFL